MALQLRLLKHGSAIESDLELSPAGWNELHPRLGKRLPELGRQTGGPWLVVSNRAVLDRDFHGLTWSVSERAQVRGLASE
jgi:hypothetical protein